LRSGTPSVEERGSSGKEMQRTRGTSQPVGDLTQSKPEFTKKQLVWDSPFRRRKCWRKTKKTKEHRIGPNAVNQEGGESQAKEGKVKLATRTIVSGLHKCIKQQAN